MPKRAESTALTVVPPQRGMFDHEVTDATLHAVIALIFKHQMAAKTHAKNRKTVRESLALMPNVKDGDRIVVYSADPDREDQPAPYVLEAKNRKGGGFNVPTWERLGLGSITKLED